MSKFNIESKKLLIKGICHKKLIQHDNKIKLFFKIENIVLLYINYQMFSYIYHYIINFVILFCQQKTQIGAFCFEKEKALDKPILYNDNKQKSIPIIKLQWKKN